MSVIIASDVSMAGCISEEGDAGTSASVGAGAATVMVSSIDPVGFINEVGGIFWIIRVVVGESIIMTGRDLRARIGGMID